MSLFRKPRKPIQRRVFSAADGDDDEEPMEIDQVVAPPPPPPFRIKEKPKQKENPAKQTLLSFADEEDDGEVFRVKKSSQSKRLARAREKERRKATTSPPADTPPPLPLSRQHLTNSRDITHTNKEERRERRERGMEGLILSGRAALAAGDEADLEEEDVVHDEAGFHTYRPENVRAALNRGQIPDAALIHAARKTRQQARETGRDYIPLEERGGGGAGARSRLVREDGSGDEEEEGRLAVRGIIDDDRPREVVRRAGRSSDAEEEGEGGGGDSGGEEWEQQQLQKAVSGAGGVDPETVQLGMSAPAVPPAPPAPRLADGPPHLRPLQLGGAASPARLRAALVDRLEQLRARRQSAADETRALRARLLGAMRTRDSRAARAPDLAAGYRRAQAARSYLTDLVECIDEKMSTLEALEARALALHRRRRDLLAERRRADTRDQAQDIMSVPGRTGGVRPADSEDKQRRTAEREGRRRARRIAREQSAPALAALHRDGDSSDDELPAQERERERQEREAISALAAQVFADALPAWRSVRGVCGRLARWRRRQPRAYEDCYVADCLPRLLAPYVRAELVLWNPLCDEDNEDYEKMDWYRCLVTYGCGGDDAGDAASDSSSDAEGAEEAAPARVTEEAVRADPDLMLAPTVVARVVLPKITELVEQAWEPLCVRATLRLRGLLLRACALPPRRLPPRDRLAAEARRRLAAALAADVFLPALPPSVMEGKGGAFWRRCLGAALRLLRAALALCPPPALLRADAVALRLVGTLCTAAGAAPATWSAGACAALAAAAPRAPGPLRTAALRRVALLAAAARQRLHSDNPLHLKALEEVRAVLSEAQAEATEQLS